MSKIFGTDGIRCLVNEEPLSAETCLKISKTVAFLLKKKNEIKKYFSKRKLVICKEITKLYEEYIRIDVIDIDKINMNLKGEITLVFSPLALDDENFLDTEDKKKIKKLIKKSSIKDIIKIISKNKKISKKEIYNFCLNIKNEG